LPNAQTNGGLTLPPDVAALVREGDRLGAEHRIEESLNKYEEAIRLIDKGWDEKTFATPSEARVAVFLRSGRTIAQHAKADEETIPKLQKAIKQLTSVSEDGTPNQQGVARVSLAHAHFQLANALQGRNDFDGAIEEFRMSLNSNPRSLAAVNGFIKLGTTVGRLDPKQIESLGATLIASGNAHRVWDLTAELLTSDDPAVSPRAVATLVRAWASQFRNPEHFGKQEGDHLDDLDDLEKGRYRALVVDVRAATSKVFQPTSEFLTSTPFKWVESANSPEAIRRAFSNFTTRVADWFSFTAGTTENRELRQQYAQQALARYSWAWALDRENSEACRGMAWSFQAHSDDIDPRGVLLDDYVVRVFTSKNEIYASGPNRVEDWENLLQMHSLVGSLFEQKKVWGSATEPRSALFQWTLAAKAEDRIQQTKRGYSAPVVHEHLFIAYRATDGSELATLHCVIAAEGYFASGDYRQATSVLDSLPRAWLNRWIASKPVLTTRYQRLRRSLEQADKDPHGVVVDRRAGAVGLPVFEAYPRNVGSKTGRPNVGINVGGNRISDNHWNNWQDHPWHDDWHHGAWHGHWHGYDHGYWDAWADRSASGRPAIWGTPAWGVGALIYNCGYIPYYNPFYTAPIVIGGGTTVNYSRPLEIVHYVVPDADVGPPGSESPKQHIGARVSDEAIQQFKEAREAFRAGNYSESLVLVNGALSKMPKDPVLHEFRALVCFAQKKYGESATTIYAVLAVGPGWNWTTMVGVYSSIDLYTTHLRALEAIAKEDPKSPDAHFLLAYHYMILGHNSSAKAELQAFLKLVPGDAVAEQLAQALSSEDATAEEPEQLTIPESLAVHVDLPELAGEWKATRLDGAVFSLTFGPETKFAWIFLQKDRRAKFDGTYALANNTLVLKASDDNILVGRITPDAAGFRLIVMGGPPGDLGLLFRMR